MRRRFIACRFFVAFVLGGAAFTLAAPPAPTKPAATDAGTNLSDVSKWPTEVVALKDGRSFAGLVRHEEDRLVEFVEVGRKPGRPMYLLVRWIPRGDIAEITRLQPRKREILTNNIAKFRNRTQITAALHSQIELAERQFGGHKYLYYRGPWFDFVSAAEQTLTRESIVRLEQMFAGFRTFIPPRLQPAQPLRIVLLSTLDEYLDYQRRADLKIKNWAYFDRRGNEIVAGGQLAKFTAQLRDAELHHRALLEQQKTLEASLRDKLAKLTASGVREEELRQLRTAARRELDRLLEQQKLDIRQAERANQELYGRQFQVLYHEAFHAYLDNYVYDRTQHEVPRWLNEGWAQVFEGGLLDAGAGTLRLDAPNSTALDALKNDLRRGNMLPLADVLRATSEHFLVRHDDATRGSHRTYLYSWGLAHYLTFQLQLLDTAALDKYIDSEASPRDPIRRFEQLVGMPMDQFQQKWRDAMLKL